MMAGNPNNWWSMMSNNPSPLIPPQYVFGSSPSIIPFNPLTEIPEPSQSWSQLLFTGVPGEEERLGFTHFQSKKLVENNTTNWDDHNIFINDNNPSPARVLLPNNIVDVIKHEVSQNGSNLYCHGHEEFQASSSSWSHNNNNHNNMVVVPVSSPRSSVTNLSSNNNNLLDFTYNNNNNNNNNNKAADHNRKNQLPLFGTSECNNNTTTGGVCNKKARGQPSSSQPPLKVRKEKLGDRITALHQLVSPFGKTDTASVLLEAIGYIRFLQTQIEALSSPYLGNGSKNNMRNQHYVHGERNSVFPEDPGQLLNDTGLKRKVAPSQDAKDKPKDLRSRGLCLVPVSFIQHVGNENNGADYWAPAYGSGF